MPLLVKWTARRISVRCLTSNMCLQQSAYLFASLLKSSPSVTTATFSSTSHSILQYCHSAFRLRPNTRPKVKQINCQIRYSNTSYETMDSFNSMIFSEERKPSVVKRMSSFKPSFLTNVFVNLPPSVRQAGVCVPLCRVDGIPSILFTMRSRRVTTDSGVVSFPGGIVDKADKDVTQTALREMNEELGINPESVDIWGHLIPVPDLTLQTCATPTVAYIGDVDMTKLKYNTDEVELAFTLPVSHLCDPQNYGYTCFDPPKSSTFFKKVGTYFTPVFRGDGYQIWGLTAVFTDLTLAALTPEHYKSVYYRG